MPSFRRSVPTKIGVERRVSCAVLSEPAPPFCCLLPVEQLFFKSLIERICLERITLMKENPAQVSRTCSQNSSPLPATKCGWLRSGRNGRSRVQSARFTIDTDTELPQWKLDRAPFVEKGAASSEPPTHPARRKQAGNSPKSTIQRSSRSANTSRGSTDEGVALKGAVRVVVVDDDSDMRLFLKDLLEGTGEFTCVGSFSTATEALLQIPMLHPQLVLMDIRMPHMTGIECTQRIKTLLPDVKIVMITGLHEGTFMQESLQAGADAYLLKPITADQCLATIKFAVKGEEETAALLTTRERQVMQFLAQGLLYKEIAERLGISYSAVHKHQHKIFLKLQATNRSEAIRRWRDLGGR
jgi:DNA-binding NarL/FixJ family response regulator